MPLAEFEETITTFVKSLRVNEAYLGEFMQKVVEEWNKRSNASMSEADVLEEQIKQLSYEARQSMDKIKYLTSEKTIKFIEEDLVRIENDIDQLQYQKSQLTVKKPVELREIELYTKYFFEHLDILLLQQNNTVAKANFFSLIFNETPSFADLNVRTPETKKTTEVTDVFLALSTDNSSWLGRRDSNPRMPGPKPGALPLGHALLSMDVRMQFNVLLRDRVLATGYQDRIMIFRRKLRRAGALPLGHAL